MSYRNILPIVLLLLCQMGASVAAASDLAEAYGWAHRNDLKYLAALSKYRADVLTEDLGKAGTRPHVAYSYRWKKNEYESDTKTLSFTGKASFDFLKCEDWTCVRDRLIGLEYKDTHNMYTSKESALTLTQSIYDPRRISERSKGKVAAEKAAVEIEAAEQDLLIRVVEAYLGVLRAVDEKDLAQKQLESIETQKKLVEKRFELGVGKETEVYDTQAAFDAQSIAFELALAKHYVALQKLSGITGVEMSVVYPVSENMPVEMPYPNEADYWIGVAMEKNPGILIAGAGEKIANFDMREKEYSHLPVVNFAAAYIQTDLEGGQGFSPAATTKAYGLEMMLPIYQGGGVTTASKQAGYRLDEAKEYVASQRQQVQMGIINILLMIKTDVKRYHSGLKAVDSSRMAYQSRSRSYKEGGSNLLDLFQAEKSYYQAKKELSSARYDYILDVLRLAQMAGTLSPKDLNDFNAWFVPPL